MKRLTLVLIMVSLCTGRPTHAVKDAKRLEKILKIPLDQLRKTVGH